MSTSQSRPSEMSFRLVCLSDVQLFGSGWYDTTNDSGQLNGFRTCGSDCELKVFAEGTLVGQYSFPSGVGVAVTGNVIAIPVSDASKVETA